MTREFDSLMIRTLLGPIVASLQLFALYVVIHGHDSPGGGFQGGALLGSSLVLPMLVHGRKPSRRFFVLSESSAAVLSAAGVFLYAAVGITAVFQGEQMLDYRALPLGGLGPADRRHYGILAIELGVTLAVAGAVVSIIYTLYDFAREERD